MDCDLDRVCIHNAKGKQKFSHLLCGHLDMNRVLKGKQILQISKIQPSCPQTHKSAPQTHKSASWSNAGGQRMWRVGWSWTLLLVSALSKVAGICNLLLGQTDQTAIQIRKGICCKCFWLEHVVLHPMIRAKPIQTHTQKCLELLLANLYHCNTVDFLLEVCWLYTSWRTGLQIQFLYRGHNNLDTGFKRTNVQKQHISGIW